MKLKALLLWPGIIFAAALVAFVVAYPLVALFMLGALIDVRHHHSPPPLANGIQFSAAIRPHGDTVQSSRWTVALHRRFPAGTMEGALLLTLQQQGFSVYPARRTAYYEWNNFPCVQTISVSWATDARHQISNMDGQHSSGCL